MKKARPEPREPEPLPDIELVAAAVHEAWMVQKRAKGITSAPSQQTGEEQLRPYAELSNEVQEYDRATVRAVYDAIQSARHRDADEECDANALGQKRAIWRHPADAAVRPASAPSLEQLQSELAATKNRMWELGHECDRLHAELKAASALSRPLEETIAKLDELADALDHARLEVREVYVRDAEAGRTCREAVPRVASVKK